jgi:hypothetical protein
MNKSISKIESYANQSIIHESCIDKFAEIIKNACPVKIEKLFTELDVKKIAKGDSEVEELKNDLGSQNDRIEELEDELGDMEYYKEEAEYSLSDFANKSIVHESAFEVIKEVTEKIEPEIIELHLKPLIKI